MAGQVSPGIVLRERDLTAQTIVSTQSNTAALVGSFAKGPVGVITNITTEREFLETFGAPNNNNYEDWFVGSTFLSYGGQLQVVRIADTTLKNADSSSTGVLISTSQVFEANFNSYTWKFAAKTAGTWANGLKVVTVDGTVLDGIATVNNIGAADVDRTAGTYTITAADYTTDGSGSGATFSVVVNGSGAATVTVTSAGTGFVVGETITIADADLGGGAAADLTFDVASLAGWNTQVLAGTQLWSTIAAAPTSDNQIHVAVLDSNNNVLETFLYLSKTSGSLDDQGASNYYKDVVNRRSAYVYAATTVSSGLQTSTLGGGVDSYTTTVSDITSAYDLFADVENITVDFILAGGSLSVEADQITKAQKAIDIASSRKDCIAFVSPHRGFISLASSSAQRDDIITFFDSVGSSTSYAVFDSGYKYIYDRYNDVYRYIPCNGDVAGLCVQTSAIAEDWFSPAGTQRGNVRNAVKLAYTPSKTDRDKLYLKRINPIASFPGQGIVLFGDKTALATPSAFDRINVRRLFLSIERRMNNLAKNVLFELNDSTTRNSFLNAASSFLAEIQAKRGVVDYLVVCDESNNTPDVIDRNEFVAEIYVKPTRSINFVTITIVATRTGVEFSEVVGTQAA